MYVYVYVCVACYCTRIIGQDVLIVFVRAGCVGECVECGVMFLVLVGEFRTESLIGPQIWTDAKCAHVYEYARSSVCVCLFECV